MKNRLKTKSPHSPISGGIYHDLIQSVQDYAILLLDADGNIISWNSGAEVIEGYVADEIIGSHISRFYPSEEVEQQLPGEQLRVASETGHFEGEGWRVRRDGSRFWAEVVITRMLNPAGSLVGFSQIARDISERRRQDLALRDSEERFRMLVTGVRDYAIFMLDTTGHVATWNEGAAHIKGYSADEIVGSHFSRFYPPDAIARQLPETELHGATLQGRYEDEGWRVRKDGSRFWANVVITAIRNSSGRLLGFAKVTRDLTERRRHEDELRASEERFRLLVEGVTEYAIMMLDTTGNLTSWNAGAERIKGYKSEEILGSHVSHFYTPDDVLANKPWEDLNIARTEGRIASEGWRVRKDGTLFWANSVITALTAPDGRMRGFAKVTQDLTHRRDAEALAETARRMHEFIAMLAHELRNPLAPICNAVALMGRKGLGDPTLEAMRQTIDRQSRQLTRLLDDLLDVNRIARGQFAIERSVVDLRDVITRAVESSAPLINARRHILEIDVPETPLLVMGDSVRLTQAIVNLLNNAAKYTAGEGKIRVEAFERGTEMEVRVSDSGKGIEHAMIEKVFDLFVQVDPSNDQAMGGLGVGLALVRRVVELHGGSIQARSEGRDRGSEFIVRLPLSVPRLRVVERSADVVTNAPKKMRVLVVDDNIDAADTLKLLLQSMGQLVSVAYDGRAAIAVAQTFQPDVVLMDIGMPQMSGYDVAIALQSVNLSIKPFMVATSGWGQLADKERAVKSGFDRHFIKPVHDETLRTLLAEVASRPFS